MSGASGVIYGIEFLKHSRILGIETHLILSKWGEKNITLETNWNPQDVKSLADCVYENENLAAAPSSGSFLHHGMIIIPCSMMTLASIANGLSMSLMTRAADVTIKEQRKLILVPRETPLNAIHLENMLKLARLGVIVAPPVPAMYNSPLTVDDIIRNFIGRMFDLLYIEHDLIRRWNG